MAPEVMNTGGRRKKPYNPFLSDMYSVGVMLYQMLTLRLPYDADNTVDYMDQVKDANKPYVPLPERVNEQW